MPRARRPRPALARRAARRGCAARRAGTDQSAQIARGIHVVGKTRRPVHDKRRCLAPRAAQVAGKAARAKREVRRRIPAKSQRIGAAAAGVGANHQGMAIQLARQGIDVRGREPRQVGVQHQGAPGVQALQSAGQPAVQFPPAQFALGPDPHAELTQSGFVPALPHESSNRSDPRVGAQQGEQVAGHGQHQRTALVLVQRGAQTAFGPPQMFKRHDDIELHSIQHHTPRTQAPASISQRARDCFRASLCIKVSAVRTLKPRAARARASARSRRSSTHSSIHAG